MTMTDKKKILLTYEGNGIFKVSYIYYGNETIGLRSTVRIGKKHKHNIYMGKIFNILKRMTYRGEK